ncbi:MAG: aminopeptidase, partial [Halalkalicoccus sp.]|nr:aminopeptidase [Halalkalicoccus sp.]
MALRPAAETAIRQCMALQPDESCAVITDDERERIGEALYTVAREITDDSVLLTYPPGPQHGAEPPEPVAAAMRNADVVLAPTSKSLSHTRARGAATDAGARAATLPGITEEVFTTGLDADYERIREECDRMREQVAGAAEIRVTSPQGTDITFEPGSREWLSDTGIVHEPGDFSNLPAGEVFVSPESAEGTYVVDGTMHPHGLLNEEIEIVVEDGFVTSVSDPEVRAELKEAQAEVGRDAYNLAELGDREVRPDPEFGEV